MNILFSICGRAGSKGIKNKNIKDFCGRPLVYYTISVIDLFIKEHKAEHDIDIVLNTDSEDLIDLVGKQTMVPVSVRRRDESLGGDAVPKVDVIKDCLCFMQESTKKIYDILVDLDITSPLRTVVDVANVVNTKINRPDTDVVYSVTDSRRNPYFNMVKEENGFFCKAISSSFTARQQAPAFYDMNASIYAYSPAALFNKPSSTFFNDRAYAVKMKDTGILDIDSEEDYELMQVIAEYLFDKYTGFAEVRNNIKM